MASERRVSLRPVGADQPAPGLRIGAAFTLDRDGDATAVLMDLPDRTREGDLEPRDLDQPFEQDTGQLGLLALQPERMPRDIGDAAEVELRDQAVLLRPVLKIRRE